MFILLFFLLLISEVFYCVVAPVAAFRVPRYVTCRMSYYVKCAECHIEWHVQNATLSDMYRMPR